ncbi:MAG: hypothetical protein D6771_05900, partial [Zetaproteobacteria bacterium]
MRKKGDEMNKGLVAMFHAPNPIRSSDARTLLAGILRDRVSEGFFRKAGKSDGYPRVVIRGIPTRSGGIVHVYAYRQPYMDELAANTALIIEKLSERWQVPVPVSVRTFRHEFCPTERTYRYEIINPVIFHRRFEERCPGWQAKRIIRLHLLAAHFGYCNMMQEPDEELDAYIDLPDEDIPLKPAIVKRADGRRFAFSYYR